MSFNPFSQVNRGASGAPSVSEKKEQGMTAYEHFAERSEFCEERCREAADSYMKEFWSKTADFCQTVIGKMTVAQAEAEWEEAR